jgi:glycosyltransferase involved in cell wall biosynthesis
MISFIVPAHNEELELPATLAAIHAAAMDVAQPYQIIVVDDASTDATSEIAMRAGAKVVRIERRQIAAARNAGRQAAQGEYLFFVDADTRIKQTHITEAISALQGGYAGGSARVAMDGFIPIWGRMLLRGFSSIFVGEEVYFSLALKNLGRFKVLREPIVTSGRKLRMYPAGQFLRDFFGVVVAGPRGARSRAKLHLWYNGKREKHPA